MNDDSVDLNVDNYSISELFAILDINDPMTITDADIMDATNQYIQKFTTENNTQMSLFFTNIQTTLLDHQKKLQKMNNTTALQTEEWYKDEALPQKDDTVQLDKVTARKQKIDVYNNNHFPMNRDALGVNNNFTIPVAQDSLNPNLKNTVNRFVVIDSQYRQPAGGVESSSTNYTLDLSEPLTDTLSLRLYSIQIPYTWYLIDNVYGNNYFYVTNMGVKFKIEISAGNYNLSDICDALNAAFVSSGFICGTKLITTSNSNTGKVSINLNSCVDPNGNVIESVKDVSDFQLGKTAYITFFDFGIIQRVSTPTPTTTTFSNTLGWLLGYKNPFEIILTYGNTANAVANLTGSKYLILVLDDLNQNQINNSIVTITDDSKDVSLPNYFNTSDQKVSVKKPDIYSEEIFLIEFIKGNLNMDKIRMFETQYLQAEQGYPKTLTQAQTYTINSIITDKQQTQTFRAKAPSMSDSFAILPIKYGSMKTGDCYVEFSGSLQDNMRQYFGPVTIRRMMIKLLDDKGQILNLNGGDWSFTLISENLYQY